jgi:hypothetical protein
MANQNLATFLSSPEMESLAYQTLVGLPEAGIRYCLWKSFDRLEQGIKGGTDFDILMNKDQNHLVFKRFAGNGWFNENQNNPHVAVLDANAPKESIFESSLGRMNLGVKS